MTVFFTAALISAVQLLLFTGCGIGLARLVLPAALRPHELTLAPLFGLALLAILGYYGTNIGLSLTTLLPIVLALAVALLGIAVQRRIAGSMLPGVLPAAELWPLLLVMLGTWLLNIWPVLRYGFLTPIGHNWDVEFYLPLVEYLKHYSYLSLADAPANPLLDLVRSSRIASRAMGASYAQGFADLLLGQDSWATWVPMLAVLRALMLPGLYALLRVGLGVRPAGALLGSALAGANGLLLWTTYNSFGMGIGGTALLPLAVLCTLLALQHGERRAIFSAGLLLGALSCIYWPILQPYGAACFGLGLAVLLRPAQPAATSWLASRGKIVLRGLLVLLIGGLVGLLAHLRAPEAFLGVFDARTPSMGVTEFIAPQVILGSAPYSHLAVLPQDGLGALLGWIGLLAAVVLLALGCWRGTRHPALAIGLAVCSLAYLLGLAFVIRFPYGLLRGASYINPLLLGLIGAGLVEWPWGGVGRWRQALRWWPALPVLLLLASTSLASYRTYAVYAAQPAVFDAEMSQARQVVAQLADPGAVIVSSAADIRGPYLGAWSYALREREMLGSTATGYQPFFHPAEGVAPRYGLVQRGEDPRAYGLDPTQRVWQGERAELYAAPIDTLAWRSGRINAYAASAEPDTTNFQRAQIGGGSFLAATAEQPLSLSLAADRITSAPLADAAAGERDLQLTLASFRAQTLEVQIGGETRQIALPAGISTYQAGTVVTPQQITLRPSDAPVILRDATLFAAHATTAAEPQPLDDTLLLALETTATPTTATVQFAVQNSTGEHVRFAVEVFEEVSGFSRTPAHAAGALFAAPQEGQHQLVLDVQNATLTLDAQPLALETGDQPDGQYFASLWVYQGEQVRRVVPFLRFERRDGAIVSSEALSVNAAFVRLSRPAQASNLATEQGIVLQGYEFSATTVAAGDSLRVSFLWEATAAQPEQPYLVFVQLLDANDAKAAQWDGAAGGDWFPTPAWQPGSRVWQDIPLQVAADAAPGTYRVVAGLYSPVDGQRLRFVDGRDMLELGQVTIR